MVCPRHGTESYELVGITSWGYGCANPLYPGVYSNMFGKKISIGEVGRK